MLTSFFIASTGQNVGKTTLCLGILSGLKKEGIPLSYMKPVGQETSMLDSNLLVDKDVVLMKDHFQLEGSYSCMSPVIIARGFTKQYLDNKIQVETLIQNIESSYKELQKRTPTILVEGTGHMGVGSIIDLNNAQVAKKLNTPVLLIASGGLGSAFDQLMLNKNLCDLYNVPILGVVLNRVKQDKKEMVTNYMQKALQRWNIPLLGCIPLDPLLDTPSISDLETLFGGSFLSKEKLKPKHFKRIRLAAASVTMFKETIEPNQLIITPAHREDIILATVDEHWKLQAIHKECKLGSGMILTGKVAPHPVTIEQLKEANIPALYTPLHSDEVLEKIYSFTAQIQKDDQEKIEEVIRLIEDSIDFPTLINLLKHYPTCS